MELLTENKSDFWQNHKHSGEHTPSQRRDQHTPRAPSTTKSSRQHKTELFEGSSGTYSVTPADQMSTLKPEKVSRPLAISGGWNAGDPWLVLHVSSSANGCNACGRTHALVSSFEGKLELLEKFYLGKKQEENSATEDPRT